MLRMYLFEAAGVLLTPRAEMVGALGLNCWHRSPDHDLRSPHHETSKRLDTIPGVGPAPATALVASIGDPKAFRSGWC